MRGSPPPSRGPQSKQGLLLLLFRCVNIIKNVKKKKKNEKKITCVAIARERTKASCDMEIEDNSKSSNFLFFENRSCQ